MSSFSLRFTAEAWQVYSDFKAKALGAQTSREKRAKQKSSAQEGLFKQLAKTLDLLAQNPRHPGLKCHEFTSLPHLWDPNGKVLEAYVLNRTPGAYRVFWCYGPDKQQITIMAITPHP